MTIQEGIVLLVSLSIVTLLYLGIEIIKIKKAVLFTLERLDDVIKKDKKHADKKNH